MEDLVAAVPAGGSRSVYPVEVFAATATETYFREASTAKRRSVRIVAVGQRDVPQPAGLTFQVTGQEPSDVDSERPEDET
ncbi:hypothetical protein [Curtobacterium citreum]|uniref:hypothetical protein n=1 Tax=Curtobacterium citreum TaxID=2036 RepID=UPI002542C213|nr:hypothetical protein [Curtobacterium citreum]WIJ45586.1 hypothetical protein QPK07_01100 [Curtobacterium citreum]